MKTSTASVCRNLAGLLVLCLVFPLWSSAAGAGAPAAERVFHIPYQSDGFAWSGADISVQERKVPFRKEPPTATHQVKQEILRSMLVLAKLPDKRSPLRDLPFLCDPAKGILYLDLNRNLDLTDDPQGVCRQKKNPERVDFAAKVRAARMSANPTSSTSSPAVESLKTSDNTTNDDTSIRFERVPVDFTSGTLPPMALSLEMCGNCKSIHESDIRIHSGWKGEISLRGRLWSLAVVDNLDGHLTDKDLVILGPAPLRKEPLDKSHPDSVRQLTRLFLQDAMYAFRLALEPGGKSLRVTVREEPVTLGELRLTGKSIRRLAMQQEISGENKEPEIDKSSPKYARLASNRTLVLLYNPGPVARVPTGDYDRLSIQLAASSQDPIFHAETTEKRIHVELAKPATSRVGGPLNPTVIVTRSGRSLDAQFALVGADKECYSRHDRDNRLAPSLAIYQGDRKLASTSFSYG